MALATLLIGATCGRSDALIDGGMGFGFGFGFQNNAYQDTQFLNSWSLQNAAAAAANRPKALTAPRFQSRDEGFFERYDPATREEMTNRVARNPTRSSLNASTAPRPTASQAPAPAPRAPAPVAAPPQPSEVVRLANFFDPERRLVWPSVAPISGDLGRKQEIADLAVLAVFNEYELQGLARLANVTSTREKLLDYGRPALDYVRRTTTPAMADSFHVFLLSLYSNVGLAATVPKPR